MKHAFVKPSLAAISLLVVLTACSSTPSAKKLEKLAAEPIKLGDFTPSVQVDRVWTAQLGDGERSLGLGQQPVVADGHVYAAAAEGSVYALDLASGKEIWRFRPEERRKLGAAAEAERLADETSLPSLDDAETKSERQRIKAQIRGIKMERKLARKLAKRMAKEKLPWRFSGGPGAGDGLVVVGTLDGVVIALDAANGEEKWRAKVPNEVIAAPSIGQGYVLIRSNDGAVTALDAATGERRWTTPRELPALTVRGNAPVTLGPGVVFVGNDDGTLGALGLNDGRVLWQLPVGLPEGRSELERMADVDGAPLLEDTTVFASSYKKHTVAIDGPSGRPLWTRDNGGVGGLSVSVNGVLLADPGGVVWALDRYTGSGLWSNSNLVRRKLTGPTVQGDYAVLGDLEGYVHWLRLDNGDIAARERISRDAIRAKPVLAGDLLLVQDTEGKLAAYRLRQ